MIDLLKNRGWRKLKWKEFAFKEKPFDDWRLVKMVYKKLEHYPGYDGEIGGILQIFEKDGKYKALVALPNLICGEILRDYGHPMESITYRLADIPEDWGGADRADS